MKSIIDTKKVTLMMVNLKDLEKSPYNHYEMSDIEDLKASIRIGGLETPLSIIKAGKKYQIISGHRRYTALSELFEETGDKSYEVIPAFCINDKLKECEQKYLIETANLEVRSKIDWNTRALAMIGNLKEMADDPDIDITENDIYKIAQKSLKVSKRYAMMYKSIFEKATDEVKDLVKENSVPVEMASQLAQYPEKIQDKAAEAIKSGAKPKNVLKNLKDIKEEAKEKKEKENAAKEIVTGKAGAGMSFSNLNKIAESIGVDETDNEPENDEFDMDAVLNELTTVDRLVAEPKNNIAMDSVGKINQQLKEEEKKIDKFSLSKASQATKYIKSLVGSKEMTSKDVELLEACQKLVNYFEKNKADISILDAEDSDYDDDIQNDYTNDYNDSDDFSENSEDSYED